MFLIIGKTHPGIIKYEGEKYRDFLQHTIKRLHLEKHTYFINQYLPLDELLDYLQLTNIYLFTSKDRNQAVSGTFPMPSVVAALLFPLFPMLWKY
jgi:glycosyltransferase involved in cell wall biosynthesis